MAEATLELVGKLHRLWWAIPGGLHFRIADYAAYFWDVILFAWRPTWRVLRDVRGEALLLGPAVLVAVLQQHQGSTYRQVLSGVAWGLLTFGILAGVVFLWNLAWAPARLQFAQVHSAATEIQRARDAAKAAEDRASAAEDRALAAEFESEHRLGELRFTIGEVKTLQREIQHLRDAAAERPSAEAIRRQLGTELRDIRQKIERVKAGKRPRYWRGLRLPAARWDEYDEFLAEDADLYAILEAAYTAAHHINEHLVRWETASSHPSFLVRPEDGLDETYDAVGEALDALGEERGEPWESGAAKAARSVAEDIARELDNSETPTA
jgi:hypothetical protein